MDGLPQLVCCADCGYLAVRHARRRELMSAEVWLRREGNLLTPDGATMYDRTALCCEGVADLIAEVDSVGGPSQDNFRLVLQNPRQCDRFRLWKQGLTPKEHREMDLLEDQRRWQAEQATIAEMRHQETMRIAMLSSRWNAWAMLVAAAIGVAGTLLAGYLSKPH